VNFAGNNAGTLQHELDCSDNQPRLRRLAMRIRNLAALAATLVSSLLLAGMANAEAYYEVTVTNITKGMTFTPIVVATTRNGDKFFRLGEPASEALEIIAETGNPEPLQNSLDAFDISNSSFLPFLAPGESVTQLVETRGRYRSISIASMLIPSNDTFFAVNGVRGPRGSKSITFTVPAYDAGSELNDELCVSLPGPGCNGDPGPVSANGEGYVYISNGIRGIGDLDAALLDWKNPVAQITITRIGRHDKDEDSDSDSY
jgi:hypothetical protein